MNSWDLRDFRNDLSIFIGLIKEKRVTGDFSDLDTLLTDIDDKDLIEYNLENIVFYIRGVIIGTVPDELNYCQIQHYY